MIPRFLRRKEWLFAFGVLGLAVAAAVFFYLSRATALSVAVGPGDGVEAQLIEAYAKAMTQQKGTVRLRLMPTNDVRQSAEALQKKRADLAVVRPDAVLPENGLTVAVLRQEALIIVAPEAGKIKEMADLAKKRLGLIARHEADPDFVSNILAYYELPSPNVTLVPLGLDEVEAAFTAKRIDAVAIIAAPVGDVASNLVRSVERVSNRKITIVPVSEGEAFAQKNPTVTTTTIPAGSLGLRPKQPDEDVKTIGVSYRLMARSDIDRTVVSEVTQSLFEMRSRVARITPAANQLKPPEFDSAATATSATLPNHPGAVDYLQREQQTFFQRYGDWIYLLMFSAGGIGSAIAWIFQRFARKRRELMDEVLDRLICILSEARGAKTVVELDGFAIEIDNLVTHSVRYARHRTTSTRTMSALILAIDSARSAIADRRRDMIDHQEAAAAPKESARPVSVPRAVKPSLR